MLKDQHLPKLAKAAGLVCTLIGLVVILGWHFRSTAVVQIHPTFVVMQFNSAVCLVLSGLALFFISNNRTASGALVGTIILLISGITFFEYLFRTNLGIDTLLLEPFAVFHTLHPGRMAPITVVVFLLGGAALICNHILSDKSLSGYFIRTLSALIAVVSGIVLCGYVFSFITDFGWTVRTRMPLQASIGMCVFAAGLYLHSRILLAGEKTYVPRMSFLSFVPVLALLITVVLWIRLDSNELRHSNAIMRRDLEVVSQEIVEELDSRIIALELIAQRWEVRRKTPYNEWKLDVQAYLDDARGFQAIEWVDSTYHIRWIEPLKGNEAAMGLDLMFDARQATPLLQARKTGQVVVSQPVDLVQGGKGLLVYEPLFVDGNFDGTILGVFRIDNLMTAVLPREFMEDFQLTIRSNKELIFSTMAYDVDRFYPSHTVVLDIRGIPWELTVAPRTQYLEGIRSSIPEGVLAAGLIFTCLLIGIIRSEQIARNYVTAHKKMDQLKTDFISVISHELRTPVTVIKGSLALMRVKFAKILPEQDMKMVDLACQNSERLVLLVNDIVDIDKITSGQMQLVIVPNNLKKMLEKSIEQCCAYPESTKVRITLHSVDENLVVMADEARFVQVMGKILSNAAKFSPEGEEVGISVSLLTSGIARISIKDNGPGIPAEFRDRIFQRFSQADGSGSRGKGGTGMGLYITKQLVDMMNGEIGFEASGSGSGGTVFWVDLPLHDETVT